MNLKKNKTGKKDTILWPMPSTEYIITSYRYIYHDNTYIHSYIKRERENGDYKSKIDKARVSHRQYIRLF